MPSIDAIVGIPHRSATKLRRARVRTTEALLKRAADPNHRSELAADTGLAADDLLAWCQRAELLGINGIGAEYAHVLAELGVRCLDDLAASDPDELLARIVEVNGAKRYVRRLPTDTMVGAWVRDAGKATRRVS